MNLDLPKAFGPDFLPVVVLKNRGPELSYGLAELFNKCIKSGVFEIVGSFHWWSVYLRMLGKGLQLGIITITLFLTGLALLRLYHLIYPRLLTGFDMLVFGGQIFDLISSVLSNILL